MTREILISAAALTTVRLTDGTRVNVAQGKPVPASADPKDAARLYEEGYLEIVELPDEPVEVEVEDESPADDFPADAFPDLARPDDWDTMTDDEKTAYVYGTDEEEEREPLTDEEIATVLAGNNSEVLGKVDGDAFVAAQALEVEKASEKPRPQLVKALEDIVAEDEGDEGDQ